MLGDKGPFGLTQDNSEGPSHLQNSPQYKPRILLRLHCSMTSPTSESYFLPIPFTCVDSKNTPEENKCMLISMSDFSWRIQPITQPITFPWVNIYLEPRLLFFLVLISQCWLSHWGVSDLFWYALFFLVLSSYWICQMVILPQSLSEIHLFAFCLSSQLEIYISHTNT